VSANVNGPVSELVIDTSAAMAILTGEPGATYLADALQRSGRNSMSAGTFVELGIVLEARLGPVGRGIADRFVRDAAIEVVAVDRGAADRATDGWRRYGKGRHPAALNYGDCFAYGLAIGLEGAAVLCTGDDFAATDLAVVRPS